MLIKDVLILAAEELGRADLVPGIEAACAAPPGTAPEGETATLLRCYHLTENEVALDHFPLKETQTFAPKGDAVLFTEFSRAPVDILEVRDGSGARVPFTVYPARLVLPRGTGEARVTYSYAPPRAGIADETAFSEKISARLLSYGVAGEYLLSGGRYAEAAVFDEKFHAALRAAGLERRKLSLCARRWV